MKKAFIIATVAAVAMVQESQAADLSFLDGPYEFLDKLVMTFYKPLIWAAVLGWAQAPACNWLIENVISSFSVGTNTLTNDEQVTMCKEGVKQYWEQFYYGGPVGNQPYDLSWSWSPS